MKTKLSFLAPTLVGLVLASLFALAACGGDNGTNSGGESSSSSPYIPPPPSPEADSININNFELGDPLDGEIKISGFIKAKGEGTVVVRVAFTSQGSGWVLFDEKPATAPIDIEPTKQVNLSSRARIDLTNQAIPCGGPYNVTVTGCTDKACKNSATDTRSFSKPEEYCRSSSSEAEVSSSSARGWRFGTLQEVQAGKGEPAGIGPGGSTFVLQETDDGVSVAFTSCNIKDTEGVNKIGVDAEPASGKSDDYPADIFPGFGSPRTSIDPVENKVYYIVTCGNDRYLAWFRIIDRNLEISSTTWPKLVKLWPITQSPEGL